MGGVGPSSARQRLARTQAAEEQAAGARARGDSQKAPPPQAPPARALPRSWPRLSPAHSAAAGWLETDLHDLILFELAHDCRPPAFGPPPLTADSVAAGGAAAAALHSALHLCCQRLAAAGLIRDTLAPRGRTRARCCSRELRPSRVQKLPLLHRLSPSPPLHRLSPSCIPGPLVPLPENR